MDQECSFTELMCDVTSKINEVSSLKFLAIKLSIAVEISIIILRDTTHGLLKEALPTQLSLI